MKKIAFSLCLSLLMFVGACGEGTVPAIPATQCFVANKADGTAKCLPIGVSQCCSGLSLQRDAGCAAKVVGIGGMPMRCMPLAATPLTPATPIIPATECVADNTCVGGNPLSFTCCDPNKTVKTDSVNCPVSTKLGGLNMMCSIK